MVLTRSQSKLPQNAATNTSVEIENHVDAGTSVQASFIDEISSLFRMPGINGEDEEVPDSAGKEHNQDHVAGVVMAAGGESTKTGENHKSADEQGHAAEFTDFRDPQNEELQELNFTSEISFQSSEFVSSIMNNGATEESLKPQSVMPNAPFHEAQRLSSANIASTEILAVPGKENGSVSEAENLATLKTNVETDVEPGVSGEPLMTSTPNGFAHAAVVLPGNAEPLAPQIPACPSDFEVDKPSGAPKKKKNFSCQTCGRPNFNSQQAVDYHKQSHLGLYCRVPKCAQYGDRFLSWRNLRDHYNNPNNHSPEDSFNNAQHVAIHDEVDAHGFGTGKIANDTAPAPAFPFGVKVPKVAPSPPKRFTIVPPPPAFADDLPERDTQPFTVAAPTAFGLNTGNEVAGDPSVASARNDSVRELGTQLSGVEIYLAFCYAMWLLANHS